MTTTSTASAELPDVDRRAIQTGTIFAASFFAADIVMHGLRITKDGIIYDGQEVKDAGAVHAALMEVLVRGAPLPHRAQPEGGPPQAAANRAVIEEAAQVLESAAAHNRAKGRTVLEWTQQDRAERLRAILAQPAASLSPLCGAQPAESRKETAQLSIGFANNDQGVHVSVMQQHAGGAVTLLHQAKVPAGDSFTRVTVAAQQAAAPGALAIEAAKLASILRGMCEGGDVHGDGVDIYADGYIAGDGDTYVVRAAALLEQVAAAPAGPLINEGTSAPGTPEAPSEPLDTALPCDIKVGNGTIRKGCKLRTLVARMELLHRMAMAALPVVTPDQRVEFDSLFPRAAQLDGGAA